MVVWLNITTERIRQLRHKGIIKAVPGKASRYKLVDAIRCYLDFKAAEVKRKQARSAQSVRLMNARTKELELRLAEKSAKLIPAAYTVKIIHEIVDMVRTEFSTLPDRARKNGFSAKQTASLSVEVNRILDRIDRVAMTIADRLRSDKKVGSPFLQAKSGWKVHRHRD